MNHIVYLFDKWTIRDRIAKDDISIMELMHRYNAAQTTDFLNTAIESKAVNLTAALLSYKQEYFPEYDAFSAFVLEWPGAAENCTPPEDDGASTLRDVHYQGSRYISKCLIKE